MKSINDELSNFHGTDYWYNHMNIFLTDGTKYMAEKHSCYWLFDIIASYQYKFLSDVHQSWVLEKNRPGGTSCNVYCYLGAYTEAGKTDPVVRRKVEFTDFEYDKAVIWVCNRVAYLPTEH